MVYGAERSPRSWFTRVSTGRNYGNRLAIGHHYRFLGTIGLHDEVILPVTPGDNELWFAVSEEFGGWGVTAQLPDVAGLEALDPETTR